MKIVYVNPFYTEGMGYIENCLPKAMAKRGHEVHLVTSTGKVYFNDPMYKEVYEKFFGPPIEEAGVYPSDNGVQIHRLDFRLIMNTIYFRNLEKTIAAIKPDVVHMWDVVTPFTLQFFALKRKYNFVVYTGNHYVLSVLDVHKQWNNPFSLLKYKWLFFKVIPGKLLQSFYHRCYAATVDAKFVAEKYMGVPADKCVITPLGVDTDVFKPAASKEDRDRLRSELGFEQDHFVALYTGRFTEGKNPLLLAKAIELLHQQGYNKIRGLFVGSGNQGTEIRKCASSTIVDFVPYYDLFKFYQVSDVGVWPAQESTSMLDAAATGIPIVVNDTLLAKERYEGNGLTYKLGNAEDLAEKILKLYTDRELSAKLGQEGKRKMHELYSWDKIAIDREREYSEDLAQLNTKR